MRVISGKYKGRRLAYNTKISRPTINRLRESIIALITPYLNDSDVLDLFAGSGALGIEALSNGAKSCVFVENNLTMLKILKTNTSFLENNYQIINKDFTSVTGKYDLIFLDPPYNQGFIQKALELINHQKLLKKYGIIVIEFEKEKFALDHFQILKEKKYGRKKIIIITKEVDDGTGTNCGT